MQPNRAVLFSPRLSPWLHFGKLYPLWVSALEIRQKGRMAQVDHHLSGMFEIDRDAGAHDRLDLSKAPSRPLGVAHNHARLQKRIHPTPFGTRP